MPQPDSGDNCCDCPSRTSPCDDCGGGGGACCQFGSCFIEPNEAACLALGYGAYYNGDGTICADIDCTLLGCCLTDAGQNCATVFGSGCVGTFIPSGFCCGVSIGPLGPACCPNDGTYSCCVGTTGNKCCNNLTEECCIDADDSNICCPIGFCVDGTCFA